MYKKLTIIILEFASTKIEAEGVKVVRNAEIVSVDENENGKISLGLEDGRSVESDHLIVAVGIDVDTNLAEASGLEVDSKRGGIIVNSELEARRDIFVAGDAANFYDQRLGRRRVEHYDHVRLI